MKFAPSVLSLDFTKFNEQFKVLNNNFEYIHFDVMDGSFVPNISFGPSILKTINDISNLIMDVHLMIVNPEKYIDLFIESGADIITFHFEAVDNNLNRTKELIDLIHSKNIKAGISVKPNTDIKSIESLLSDLDLILVMSVEPGFGGQEFMNSSLDKIKYLKEQKETNNYKYIIEIDGGINDITAKMCKEAGVELAVVGSYLFEEDLLYKTNILKNI